MAGAVMLPASGCWSELRDSKLLSARQREAWAQRIRESGAIWALGEASVDEIDRINIFQATLLAMQRAVSALTSPPRLCLIDGKHAPRLSCAVLTIVDGDTLAPSIMAAAILAKVTRDAYMERLDVECPGYGFAKHKGYSTAAHVQALQRCGATSHHRQSFAPVRSCAERLL
jgi:ribonuclease HII